MKRIIDKSAILSRWVAISSYNRRRFSALFSLFVVLGHSEIWAKSSSRPPTPVKSRIFAPFCRFSAEASGENLQFGPFLRDFSGKRCPVGAGHDGASGPPLSSRAKSRDLFHFGKVFVFISNRIS